jgi:hypothetical protein
MASSYHIHTTSTNFPEDPAITIVRMVYIDTVHFLVDKRAPLVHFPPSTVLQASASNVARQYMRASQAKRNPKNRRSCNRNSVAVTDCKALTRLRSRASPLPGFQAAAVRVFSRDLPSVLAPKTYIIVAAPSPVPVPYPSARGKFHPQGVPPSSHEGNPLTRHSFTLTSEDSSEVAFLLVENYNYDRSCWSSDRQGIFDKNVFLFIVCCGVAAQMRKRVRCAFMESGMAPSICDGNADA